MNHSSAETGLRCAVNGGKRDERDSQRRRMRIRADRAERMRGGYVAYLGRAPSWRPELFSESTRVRGLNRVHQQDQQSTRPGQSRPGPCLYSASHLYLALDANKAAPFAPGKLISVLESHDITNSATNDRPRTR